MNARSIPLAAIGCMIALGPALADDLRACVELSFAPLDDNVPACDAVLASDALTPELQAIAYAARAEALQFALTYSGDHEIDAEALLRDALSDLDEAVRRNPAYLGERAGVRIRLGQLQAAREDFSRSIDLHRLDTARLLERRALVLNQQGDTAAAIEDLSAAIDLTPDGREALRFRMVRAGWLELAGDVEAAAQDYRAVLDADPEYAPARARLNAIER